MRRLSTAILALFFVWAAASAQTSTTLSAMGMTSPLGTLGTSGASGTSGTGTPLAATEIDPGGLSPLATPTCNASGSSNSQIPGTSSITSTTSAGSIFDGGGLSAAGSAS